MDDGIRCDEHVGEVFPPRCAACDALRAEPREPDPLPAPQWAPTLPPDDGWGRD